MRWHQLTLLPLLPLLIVAANPLWASSLQSEAEFETRLFANEGLTGNSRQAGSVALTLSYYQEFSDSLQLNFKGFVREDSQDSERSHADIRELYLGMQRGDWEYQVGINTLFWGVTESVNIVDVVNQTDGVEGLSSGAKLGQPLIKVTRLLENGSFDFLILPKFRVGTFAGTDGRFNLALPVDTDSATYESSAGDNHVDFAFRYATSIDDIELGLSGFSGTSREATLVPNGVLPTALNPHYSLINHVGVDLQWINDAWLWKLEMAHRTGDEIDSYSGAVGGVEYTLYDPLSTGSDIGLIAEGLYDSRGDNATTPFSHDVMLGIRWVANDEAGSEALVGWIKDTKNGSSVVSAESSRRFGENWKGKLEMQVFESDADDLLYSFRDEDYLQITFTRYF